MKDNASSCKSLDDTFRMFIVVWINFIDLKTNQFWVSTVQNQILWYLSTVRNHENLKMIEQSFESLRKNLINTFPSPFLNTILPLIVSAYCFLWQKSKFVIYEEIEMTWRNSVHKIPRNICKMWMIAESRIKWANGYLFMVFYSSFSFRFFCFLVWI